MNPEIQTEGQDKTAPMEKPSSAGPPQPDPRRRHSRGRSRFKRDPRGERPPRRDQPQPRPVDGHAQGHGHNAPSGNIGKAIEQVEGIRGDLQRALEDIEEVLRTLEQVDREKTASEEEIDTLRESLRLLQREPGQGRYARPSPQPRNAPTGNSTVPAAAEDAEEED